MSAFKQQMFWKKKQQQEMHTFVCTLVLSIVSSNCVQKGKPSSDQDKEDVTELKQNKQQLRNMAEMKSENWWFYGILIFQNIWENSQF